MIGYVFTNRMSATVTDGDMNAIMRRMTRRREASRGDAEMVKKEHAQTSWNEQLAADMRQLVRLAVDEDLEGGQDWTTVALVPEAKSARAFVVARVDGVIAGLAAGNTVLDEMDCRATFQPFAADGDAYYAGQANRQHLWTCQRNIDHRKNYSQHSRATLRDRDTDQQVRAAGRRDESPRLRYAQDNPRLATTGEIRRSLWRWHQPPRRPESGRVDQG